MATPHILLTGAAGQLGRELASMLECRVRLTAVTRNSKPGLNLADIENLPDTISSIAPDLVINCAAYTAVDKAESETGLAQRINGDAPGVIARCCAGLDIPLIHYSTDYVFDGSKGSPYTEDDTPCPINVYGRSKLAGEEQISSSGCRHYILRTSWVYAAAGQNFLNTMLRLAHEHDALSIIDDQHGSPTWTGHIALETIRLVKMLTAGNPPKDGIYHLTCSGETTWHDFAAAIFRQAVKQGLIEKAPELTPISTEQYPTAARRPLYSVLDNSKVQAELGLQAMSWQDGLLRCMAGIS